MTYIPAQELDQDAFNRLRTSEARTIFDSKQIRDNNPLLWDDQETSGSGTASTHSTAKASSIMTVSALTAGTRIRQTFRRFNYQPGKSQLVFMTGTLGSSGGGTGIQRCAGIYDDNNGIFFRDNQGIVEAVIRSSTTGSAVENAVAQSSWNMDKLDGTGTSGITLNGANSQVIVIDYEWLSVGQVRLGFMFKGVAVYAHIFRHSNEIQGAYMSTPNLPVRFEITNDGTGIASGLEQICATVISEGGHHPKGVPYTHSTAINAPVQCSVADTLYMVCGIRLTAAAIVAGCEIELIGISILDEDKGDYSWKLIHNPTMSNETWSTKAGSAIETTVGQSSDPSTSTITGGHVIAEGWIVDKSSETIMIDSNLTSLGSSISGTPDELVLAFEGTKTNGNVLGTILWKEL